MALCYFNKNPYLQLKCKKSRNSLRRWIFNHRNGFVWSAWEWVRWL